MNGFRIILECHMRKPSSSRKSFLVRLIVPDNGSPMIEYQRDATLLRRQGDTKSIPFVDLLFADKSHDPNEKWAFSIYSINRTVTFLPQDETITNEWLTKIREIHSELYPEFKSYDAIFEANLLEKGLVRTMHIQGFYRIALCKDSLDLIPLLTDQDQQQHQQIFKIPASAANTAASNSSASISSISNNQHHHHPTHSHLPHHPPFESHLSKSNSNHSTLTTGLINSSSSPLIQSHHHHPASHHHHLPQHLPSHQRFCKRHPLLASRTIELVLQSIRRVGHTDTHFYIESGRHSQVGEGDLWLALNKKAPARHLHELMLATMKLASNDDQSSYKGPRSRSGSSSDNAHRQSQSRSSSLICLAAEISHQNQQQQQQLILQQQQLQQHSQVTSTSSSGTTTYSNAAINGTPATATTTTAFNGNSNNNNNNVNNINNNNNNHHPAANNILSNLFGTQAVNDLASELKRAASKGISTSPMFLSHDKKEIEQEDSGYLPMA